MDNKNKLLINLLSKKNINLLSSYLITKHKINKKSEKKCQTIIITYLSQYINNLDELPKNDDELTIAIDYLNKKCIKDFDIYIQNKYPPKNNIIILSESEKDELVNNIGIIESPIKENNINILPYLQDPLFINIFETIVKPQIEERKNMIVFDEIITEEHANMLISNTYSENNTISKDINEKNTIDNIIKINSEITELQKEKDKYQKENNIEMIEKIDNEQKKYIETITKLKDNLEMETEKTEDKIKKLSVNKIANDLSSDKLDYLDLEIDPTNDYNDMKNIHIVCKVDNKINIITLVSYFVPFNKNNIFRFNNSLKVYYDNQVHNIIVEPDKYDTNQLIAYLGNKLTFLIFNVKDEFLSIKTIDDALFDLLIDDYSILKLLGFNENINSYKNKNNYSASEKINLNVNQQVLFSLSSAACDPINLEFDKPVTINKVLKKSSSGITLKKLILNFKTLYDYYYDFTKPFKICLKISYL